MAIAQMAGRATSPAETAQAAYEAEVVEFGESGGMMDHFASAFGGLIHLDCGNNNALTRLPAMIDGIVIGDSKEKKADTVGDLRAIRSAAEEGYRLLGKRIRGFDNRRTSVERALHEAETLPESCRKVVTTTILNRDLTRRALKLLLYPRPDPVTLGDLIEEHHRLLRDGLGRSTEKIERMIAAAKEAGALGCKINGSGGGGTMMALSPGKEREVSEAIESVGGAVHVTRVGEGASVTLLSI
jgi:galactokinase